MLVNLGKVTRKVEERVQIGEVMFLKTNCLLYNLTEEKVIKHREQIPPFSLHVQTAAFIIQPGLCLCPNPGQPHGLSQHITTGSQYQLIGVSMGKDNPLPCPAWGKHSPSFVVYPQNKMSQNSQKCKQEVCDYGKMSSIPSVRLRLSAECKSANRQRDKGAFNEARNKSQAVCIS